MIIGIGIDIIEIERIKKSIETTRLLERIFTSREVEYFKSREYNISTISGSFATKEAMVKALGTGIGKIGWKDIEVLRNSDGKPYVKFRGGAKDVLESLGGKRIHVSISHSKLYAVSQVIVEG